MAGSCIVLKITLFLGEAGEVMSLEIIQICK